MSEFYAKSSNKSWSPGKRFHILYLRPLGDKLCETVTSGWRPYFTISRGALCRSALLQLTPPTGQKISEGLDVNVFHLE